MASLRLFVAITAYLACLPSLTLAHTSSAVADTTSLLELINSVFAEPSSKNNIQVNLPAVTQLPCCGPGCPFGLCTPPSSVTSVTPSPTPTFGGIPFPFPQWPFQTPQASAGCAPGCCNPPCNSACCRARMLPTSGTTGWIAPTKQPLPVSCAPGDCSCGGPLNCYAVPPPSPPSSVIDQTCPSLPPNCPPGDCNCGGRCNCRARPIPPPPATWTPADSSTPGPSSTTATTTSISTPTATPTLARHPLSLPKSLNSKCAPGDCKCGNAFNCHAPIPEAPSGSASDTPATESEALHNATAGHPGNPNYIPLILQQLTSPPTPVLAYAQILLSSDQNIISAALIASLYRTDAIVRYAQGNHSASPIPASVFLDVIAGRHGSVFKNVEFNVFEAAAEDAAVLAVGTDFLTRAYALRLAEEYGDVVGRGVLDVLVGVPGMRVSSVTSGADGAEKVGGHDEL